MLTAFQNGLETFLKNETLGLDQVHRVLLLLLNTATRIVPKIVMRGAHKSHRHIFCRIKGVLARTEGALLILLGRVETGVDYDGNGRLDDLAATVSHCLFVVRGPFRGFFALVLLGDLVLMVLMLEVSCGLVGVPF